jgi:hypothetical protein
MKRQTIRTRKYAGVKVAALKRARHPRKAAAKPEQAGKLTNYLLEEHPEF